MQEVDGSSPFIFTKTPPSAAIIGVIAQLVERLNGIQEVMGSTPISSTTKKAPTKGAFFTMLLGWRTHVGSPRCKATARADCIGLFKAF